MTAGQLDRALQDRLTAAGVHHATAAHLASLDPAERADAERLAQARHRIALGDWDELNEDERVSMVLSALHWLRAARAAGLASPGAPTPAGHDRERADSTARFLADLDGGR